jgi:hypothetical protein
MVRSRMGATDGWREAGWAMARHGRIGLAAVVVMGLGLAGCGAGSPPSSAVNPGTGSDQSLYVASALQDRNFLFDGFVVTHRTVSTGVNQALTVLVEVCGSQAASHDCQTYRRGLPSELTDASPSASSSPTPSATSSASPTAPANPDLVRLGGLIKTTLTSPMPGQIQAESTEQQPVLTSTESASWEWVVTPTATGSYTLQVHLSVLQGSTGAALLPDQTVDISLDVHQTNENTVQGVWNGIKEFAVVLGASGVTLGAIIAFVARRLRRRKTPAGAAPLTGPPSPPSR